MSYQSGRFLLFFLEWCQARMCSTQSSTDDASLWIDKSRSYITLPTYIYHSTYSEMRRHFYWMPEFEVLQPLQSAAHDQFPHSLFPLWNHITPPSSSPRSPLSILSQSHLVNMSWARLRNLISGDGSTASEAETCCGISQKRLTGERGGGELRWEMNAGCFFFAVTPCCVTSWATSCIYLIEGSAAIESSLLILMWNLWAQYARNKNINVNLALFAP